MEPQPGDDVVREGRYGIFKKENVLKAYQIRADRPIWLAKQSLVLNGAIGHPYGSNFEIDSGLLRKVEETSEAALSSDEKESDEISTKDNRFLVDDSKSQLLTRDDIQSFKQKGLSGKEIVKHLITNSTTFKDKNEYSQAKYVKKKHIKHSNYVTILKPTARLLAEMLYAQGPLKVLNMRIDTLAQMLTMGNVHAGGQYIVFESCHGIVVASVMERLGNSGNVIQLFAGGIPQKFSVEALNLPKDHLNRLLQLKVEDALLMVCPEITLDETDTPPPAQVVKSLPFQETNIKTDNELQNGAAPSQKLLRQEERAKAIQILKERNLDGLFVASKYSPLEVLPLLSFLNFSRPFVIYCANKEPLIECYTKLKKEGRTIFLNLTESWLRKYQIMPERTHPDINMSGGGGYLLTGITVAPNYFK